MRWSPRGPHECDSLPPDGQTDAHLARGLGRASRIVYVSTTGVFGEARGHIDESTPVDPREPSAQHRRGREHRDQGDAVLALPAFTALSAACTIA